MGEGWGDWYALNHAQVTGLEPTRAVVGAYATGNEKRGIRNYDFNVNPNTFGDMGYDLTGPEVHADPRHRAPGHAHACLAPAERAS